MAMQQAAPMGADPAMGGDDPSANPESYTIEITVNGDGTFLVNVEDGQTEAAEESGQGGMEPGEAGGDADGEGTTCRSIKEALSTALAIFKNDGQLPGKADDSFQQGFSGGAGS